MVRVVPGVADAGVFNLPGALADSSREIAMAAIMNTERASLKRFI
jgi:hypothetical protein